MKILNNLVEVPPGRYRYHQEETNSDFGPYGNFGMLMTAVRVHRKSNNLPPGEDLETELQDWMCKNMPSASMYCHEQGEQIRPTPDTSETVTYTASGWDGSEWWKRLHLYALFESPAPAERAAWLVKFKGSLPCGTCKRNWLKLTRQKPLSADATSDEFFEWTVDRHNDVNRDIAKPEISVDEAKEIWSA